MVNSQSRTQLVAQHLRPDKQAHCLLLACGSHQVTTRQPFSHSCRYTSTAHQLRRKYAASAEPSRAIDSPNRNEKSTCRLYRARFPAEARGRADPGQATCTRGRGVTAGRRLAVTVWSYKDTRLLVAPVVGEGLHMRCCRSVTGAVYSRRFGRCGASTAGLLLDYWSLRVGNCGLSVSADAQQYAEHDRSVTHRSYDRRYRSRAPCSRVRATRCVC